MYCMKAVVMIRGGSQSTWLERPTHGVVHDHAAVAEPHQGVGVGGPEGAELVGQLVDGDQGVGGLHRGHGDAVAPALLAPVAEVLLGDRGPRGDDRDPGVAVALQPVGDERRVAADVAVAEAEAVVAVEGVGAAHADDRHLLDLGLLDERHRRVGVVGADDGEAAGLAQPAVGLDALLGGALREPGVLLQHELVAAVEHPALDGLVEGHADLALEALHLQAVQADLDRFEAQPAGLDLGVELDGHVSFPSVTAAKPSWSSTAVPRRSFKRRGDLREDPHGDRPEVEAVHHPPRQQPPGVVLGRRVAAQGGQVPEVVAHEVALVGPPVLDGDGRGHVVADVEVPRRPLHQLPVDEGRAGRRR